MAKRKFSTDLSVKGIENLKKQIEDYRDVELPNKCRKLVMELAQIGVEVSQAKINESPLGKYVTLRTQTRENEVGCKAILIATGEIKQTEGYAPFNTLLAIEFGAGIYHNPIPNPNADKIGYGVGTFPGQIHAFEDGWYYWDDKNQEWRYTHGVKATMPMYNAENEMIQNVVRVAKEVFS